MPGSLAAPLASFQQAAIFSPGASVGRNHMAGKKASCSPDSLLPSPEGARQAPLSQWGKGRLSEWEGCQQYCVSLKALYYSLTSKGQQSTLAYP